MTQCCEVLIVGAGPAGAVAATVLGRAGARVRIFDRDTFPRGKLCGDTVNPGTVAMLRRLNMAAPLERGGLPVDGMVVTGPDGVAVVGKYPDGICGRSMTRHDLDWTLLQSALAAGAEFEPGVAIRRALVDRDTQRVAGVVTSSGQTVRAPIVIAADGRHSTLAFGLGLARHPRRPRRWAVGAYFDAVCGYPGATASGEMHVRQDGYIGVAPVPGGLTNVCVVQAFDPLRASIGPNSQSAFSPEAVLWGALTRDRSLRDRFAGARLMTRPRVLGPLAVDADGPGIDGLLLAGDAAGFIDPMTGDGLRFAVRGAELAAAAALRVLEHGWTGIHAGLATVRRREFVAKLRFNRLLRMLVASPTAVRVGEATASVAPSIMRAIVRHAGDCALDTDSRRRAAQPRI